MALRIGFGRRFTAAAAVAAGLAGSGCPAWATTRAADTQTAVAFRAAGKITGATVFSRLAYGISCNMEDDGTLSGSWVYCWIGASSHPTRHVKLSPGGHFSVTASEPIPLGLGGPTMAYGRRITVGRFTCQSLHSGMRCTVISSGKGVLFSKTGARRV